MYWYDVEVYHWSSSKKSNQDFIQAMIDEGNKLGIKHGIYTSYYNWESIVGLDWDVPAKQGLPLWYAHFDNNPSFSDFAAFGGWSKPDVKQYEGTHSTCGVGVDYDWMPANSADAAPAEAEESVLFLQE